MSANHKLHTDEPVSKTRLRLWLRFLKVSNNIKVELREKLHAEFGSTLPRFDVLSALYRYGAGLKMGQLSGVLKVSNGNVTGIVNHLVREGMVIRVPVLGDKRASLVRLTGKGKEHFAIQAAAHERWIDALFGDVGASEAEDIIRRLDVLAASVGEKGRKK